MRNMLHIELIKSLSFVLHWILALVIEAESIMLIWEDNQDPFEPEEVDRVFVAVSWATSVLYLTPPGRSRRLPGPGSGYLFLEGGSSPAGF